MKFRLLALLLALNLFLSTAVLLFGSSSPALASSDSRGREMIEQKAGSPALSENEAALQQETPEPTRVRPTPTPIATPPPADPESTNLMIGFGVLAVVVVIVGVWLNRERVG